MRVARSPYLNAAPFYAGWGASPPFDVVDMVPSVLGAAAAEGTIDAGLMAIADVLDRGDAYELIQPGMGVAARRHVRSVILLSNGRPQDLDGRPVVLTTESSTSVRLVKLLARARWNVSPQWIPENEVTGDIRTHADGVLLIGDRALEAVAAPDRGGWVRTTDLASEWWAWQQRPFVFAVWVVASALPAGDKARLGGFLTGSLAVGRERLSDLARAHSGVLGTTEDLEAYLTNFDYRLDTEELEAIDRFGALLAEYAVTGSD